MAKDQLMDLEKALELFEPVLGFEVHVELSTDTKMFSAAPNPAAMDEATVDPNTCITPLCLGLPGSLPVVNEKAVEYSISLGLALGCDIAPVSRFARKNYFYPDLAKNYQISQYDEPIAFEGSVSVEMDDGTLVEVPIERAHMEEDAGKLTHVGGATGRIQGAEYSLVDYNRAGVPLVEIVTKPIEGMEHRAGELGRAYVSTIRDIVRNLGISHARMERGNLRCDANVSLRPRGQKAYGTRTETKNVNSFRSIERAVIYEIRRQAVILAEGGSHVRRGCSQPGRGAELEPLTHSPFDRHRQPGVRSRTDGKHALAGDWNEFADLAGEDPSIRQHRSDRYPLHRKAVSYHVHLPLPWNVAHATVGGIWVSIARCIKPTRGALRVSTGRTPTFPVRGSRPPRRAHA